MSFPTGTPVRAARPYLDALAAALERSRAANEASLAAAVGIVAATVGSGGIVHVFGSGHSQLAALELNERAGSIAALQVIYDPTWGSAEHLDGYGATLLGDDGPGRDDCLIVISHSGVTAAGIEIARRAREAGAPVIAVTSLEASRQRRGMAVGEALDAFADVVVDDGSGEHDPGISVAGLPALVGPTSTIASAALLHEVIVGAVQRLAVRGMEAPVLWRNADEGGREHNARLRRVYRARTRRVP